jgi:hypothetical protein
MGLYLQMRRAEGWAWLDGPNEPANDQGPNHNRGVDLHLTSINAYVKTELLILTLTI